MAKKPDSFYFDNYVACADLAVQAAELLTKIFENFDPAKIHDMLNKMHAIEHAADKKHHELEDALLTAFITPLEREDLDLMSCSLDTVLDRIEGVVQRVYFTNIQSIHPDAIVIAHKVTDACRRAAQLPQVQDPARTRHPDQHHRVRSRRALYQRHAQPAR